MNQLLTKIFIGFTAFTPCIFGQDSLVIDPGGLSGGMNISPGYIVTIGYEFTVAASPINVFSLGVFNWSGNGLNNSHEIGIWDLQGDLLTSATVPAGSGSNAFLYSAVTPVLLEADQSYIIGATYIDRDSDLIGISNSEYNGSPTYNSDVTFDTGIDAASSTGMTYPNITDLSYILGEFGPNAEIEVVPEPSTVELLGTLILMLFFCQFVVSLRPNTLVRFKVRSV